MTRFSPTTSGSSASSDPSSGSFSIVVAYPSDSSAQEHLATATTMYREMDMRFWLEKAEAQTPS